MRAKILIILSCSLSIVTASGTTVSANVAKHGIQSELRKSKKSPSRWPACVLPKKSDDGWKEIERDIRMAMATRNGAVGASAFKQLFEKTRAKAGKKR